MADAPWRCSQCGTINEPVANACRTCGRWPSLFDLEESKIEDAPAELAPEEPDDMAEPDEVEPFEPEVGQPFSDETVIDPPAPAPDGQPTPARRSRRLARLIVPLGVALYILITSIANR